MPAESPQDIGPGGRQEVVPGQRLRLGERVQDRERTFWSERHRDRDGAVELHDGRRLEAEELVERRYPCGKQASFASTTSVLRARVEPLACARLELSGSSVQLQRYVFPDGAVVEEFVQHCERNCNEYVFIALRDGAGNSLPDSLWQSWEIGFRANGYCKHTC